MSQLGQVSSSKSHGALRSGPSLPNQARRWNNKASMVPLGSRASSPRASQAGLLATNGLEEAMRSGSSQKPVLGLAQAQLPLLAVSMASAGSLAVLA